MEFLEDNKRISWKTSSQYVWILREWINSLNQLSVMCNKLPQTQQFKTTDASQFLLCQESRQSLTGAGDSHGSSRDAIKVLSRTVSARGLIVKGSASNCTYMAIVHVCVCVCMCAHVCILMASHVCPFGTLWTVARQALLSMGFSLQECWGKLLFPLPGDLPDPEIEPASLA